MSIPNIISIGRIFLVPLFALMYSRGNVTGAMGVLLLSAASDVLDGAIARRCHMETELGRALDPIADKLIQAAMMLCAVAGSAPAERAEPGGHGHICSACHRPCIRFQVVRKALHSVHICGYDLCSGLPGYTCTHNRRRGHDLRSAGGLLPMRLHDKLSEDTAAA